MLQSPLLFLLLCTLRAACSSHFLLLSQLKGRLSVSQYHDCLKKKNHFRLEFFTRYERDFAVELSATSCIARIDILSHMLHEMWVHMYFVHSAVGSQGGLLLNLLSSNSAASLRVWQRRWAGSSVRVWSTEDVCSASLTKLHISCCICLLLYCLPAGDDLNSDVLPRKKKKKGKLQVLFVSQQILINYRIIICVEELMYNETTSHERDCCCTEYRVAAAGTKPWVYFRHQFCKLRFSWQ